MHGTALLGTLHTLFLLLIVIQCVSLLISPRPCNQPVHIRLRRTCLPRPRRRQRMHISAEIFAFLSFSTCCQTKPLRIFSQCAFNDPNVPVHSLFTRTPASPSQLCDNHSFILVDTIIPPEIRGVGTIRPEPHCDGFHDRIIFGKQGGLIQRAVPPDLHRGRVDARDAPRKQNRVLTARQPAHQDVLNSISFGWARLELRAILRD